MLSIIIPTWNEEKYLPKLLDCIKSQTYKDYEIVIADGNSTDKTREIARKYGCRVVREPLNKSHPGIARNLGAKTAKGDILAFLEADAQFNENFLTDALKEFNELKLDIAGLHFIPLSNKLIDKIIIGIFNLFTSIAQFFHPSANGSALFCKKWLHKKVHGFDEKIYLGEDFDYVSRCGKHGKFRILKKPKLYFSMRRFENEGRIKVSFKYIFSGTYRLLFGPVKTDVFHYNLKYEK